MLDLFTLLLHSLDVVRCACGRWSCLDCGSSKFYDAAEAFQQSTEHGLWVYMPHGGPPAPHVEPRVPVRPAGRRAPVRTHVGYDPHEVPVEASEQPESEAPTNDPSVDPDTLQVLPRRRRRRRRGASVEQAANAEDGAAASPTGRRPLTVTSMAQHEPNPVEPRNEILEALRQLLDERKQKRSPGSDTASWNSRQGPEKHVKWRGGAAPVPPQWKPQQNDLRAFARWERRIEIWRLQVSAYMPPQDAALLTSLTGEAELEVEHLDLKRVHDRNGVQYILDTLREPLQQKQLFQKRTLLDSFEKLSRFPNESLRQYINRYRRVEKDLEAIGISSSNMYDSESKGNRLLERARLAPELQRLVMIAAGNSLEYERNQEALALQFPDFKPPPAVFQKERDHVTRTPSHGKGSYNSSAPTSASSSWSSSSSRPSSKGFGKSQYPKRAFVAEQVDDLGDIPEQPEDEQLDIEADDNGFHEVEEEFTEAVDNDIAEEAPESEIQDTVAQLADVLTVTSKKLQSTVLGRKFTGRPRTIEERKRTSTCSACGKLGHWHGDPSCPQSGSASQGHDSKGRGKHSADGKGKGQRSNSNSSTQYAKQAFMVRFPDTDDQEKTSENTSFFSYTTFLLDDHVCSTYMTELIDFSGTMILDTACQRACCGRVWLDLHTKILDTHRLSVKHIETADMFQFGSGGPKRSAQRTYFPASLAGQEAQGLLLGVNVLDADVPFLASNTMLQKLGCIIDTSQSLVSFAVLGVTLPLEFKHGHWAVNICCFPPRVHQHACWKELSKDSFWLTPDPEVILSEAFLERDRTRAQFDPPVVPLTPHAHHRPATGMASEVENHHLEGDDDRVQSLGSDVPACEVWFETTPMDDGVGTGRDQEGSVEGRGTVLEDDSSTIPCRLAHTRSSEGMAIGAEATLSASDAWQSSNGTQTIKDGFSWVVSPLRDLHPCRFLLRTTFSVR